MGSYMPSVDIHSYRQTYIHTKNKRKQGRKEKGRKEKFYGTYYGLNEGVLSFLKFLLKLNLQCLSIKRCGFGEVIKSWEIWSLMRVVPLWLKRLKLNKRCPYNPSNNVTFILGNFIYEYLCLLSFFQFLGQHFGVSLQYN